MTRIGVRKGLTYGSFGFHEEEVNGKTLQYQDDNVYNIKFPLESSQTNRIDILVEDSRETGEDEAERQSLGANLEGQDFDSV